MQTFL